MQHLIKTLQHRRKGIVFILKMIPDNLWHWCPADGMRTISQLATHLGSGPTVLLKLFQDQIPDEAAYRAIEEINTPVNAHQLIQNYDSGLIHLISYIEANLDVIHKENIKWFYTENPSSIYREVFDDIGHCWFHLGQLYIYLRQNGVPINMGAYYGFKDPDPNVPPNK